MFPHIVKGYNRKFFSVFSWRTVKYFFPQEMWKECGYVCIYLWIWVVSSVWVYIHIFWKLHLGASPQWSLALLLLCLARITVIRSSLETLELFHFQLLVFWARNGRSHPKKHSRGENRWLDKFFKHTRQLSRLQIQARAWISVLLGYLFSKARTHQGSLRWVPTPFIFV